MDAEERCGALAGDDEALDAFNLLCRLEGIIPALESAHAVAHAVKIARGLAQEIVIIVNLSGRGDKDMETVRKAGDIQNPER